MVEQFSSDRSSGKDGTVVYLWAATLNPNESDAFSKRAAQHVRDDVAGLPGFLDARILEADDETSVIIVTRWETRHAWAQSQWNQKIGRVLAESFQSSVKIVDTMCYERAAVGPPESHGERLTSSNH